jgi:thioredoxin 1
MAGPNTLEFTDENFEAEVLGADTPVLVDFGADWCGPCRALGPIIDELAGENAGKVKVGKLDTDASQQTAVRYAVSSIPTVILFNKGEIVERFVGLRQKRDFQTAMDALAS